MNQEELLELAKNILDKTDVNGIDKIEVSIEVDDTGKQRIVIDFIRI